jgi:hypothetical protein
MYIFIFDYSHGKVFYSKLPKAHQEDPENFIIKKGFSLGNIHYMTTSTKTVFKI